MNNPSITWRDKYTFSNIEPSSGANNPLLQARITLSILQIMVYFAENVVLLLLHDLEVS